MKRVLFVCVANSGRSQMAEGFFNEFAAGWGRAYSAGTRPAPWINPLNIALMAEVGIDISANRPKRLSAEMLEQADVVVTLGYEVRAACPPALSDPIQWDIEEPHGKPVEVVRRIREEIRVKVLELIEQLQSTPRAAES